MPLNSTLGDDGYVVDPIVSPPALWNPTNTALRHPVTGVDVPIGGDSILSVAHFSIAAKTAVNSGGFVPFDTALRNDLTLAMSGGIINLPVGVTQFRFGYHVQFDGASNGVASAGTATAATRRINPVIISGDVGEDEAALGILTTTLQYPGLSAGGGQALVWPTIDTAGGVLTYQSPWIDVADLATAPSGVAGQDTVSVTITHNAGAGALSVLANSSIWLETMTPNV